MTTKQSVLCALLTLSLSTISAAGLPITLTVSKSQVTNGETVSLTWAAPGATSCTPSWTNQTSTAFGSGISKALTANTRFTVTCIDSKNIKSSTSTLVTVPSIMKMTLTASSTSLQKGESTTLHWKSEHASKCTSSWSTYQIDTEGSYTTDPLIIPTTFSVRCVSADGIAESKSIRINIAPLVITLTASPTTVIEGATTTITLATVGASYCTPSWSIYTRGVSAKYVTQPLYTTTAYTVTCGSPDGQLASKRVTVTTKKPVVPVAPVKKVAAPTPLVVAKATTTPKALPLATTTKSAPKSKPIAPAPTPAKALPNKISIIATPSEIASGATTTLVVTSNDMASCTSSWDSAFRGTSGTWSTPRLTETTAFSVTCIDKKNVATTTSAVVSVVPPSLTLSVSNHVIKKGTPLTLSWQARGLVSCVSSWKATPLPLTGSEVLPSVTSSHLFTIVCKTPMGVTLKRYEYVLAY